MRLSMRGAVRARPRQLHRRMGCAERGGDVEQVVQLRVGRLHVLLHAVGLVGVNRHAGVVEHLPELLDLVHRDGGPPLAQLLGCGQRPRAKARRGLVPPGAPPPRAPPPARPSPGVQVGIVPAISCSYGVGPAGAAAGARATGTSAATRPPPRRRRRRAAQEVLDRAVHQLRGAQAAVDDVLERRLAPSDPASTGSCR